jgi:H+/Cl- antiporter ClcA
MERANDTQQGKVLFPSVFVGQTGGVALGTLAPHCLHLWLRLPATSSTAAHTCCTRFVAARSSIYVMHALVLSKESRTCRRSHSVAQAL